MKRFMAVFMVAIILVVSGCSSEETAPEKLTVAVTIIPQASFVEAVAGDLVDVVTLVPPGASPANYQPSPQQMTEFGNASIYFTIGVPTEAANIIPNIASTNDDVEVVELAHSVDEVYPPRMFEDEHEHEDEHEDHEDEHEDEHEDHEHEHEDEHEDHEDEHEDEHEDHEDEHEDEHEDHEDEHEDGHEDHEEGDEDHHHHSGRDPHIWMSPKRVAIMVDVIASELSEIDPDNAETYEANAQAYIKQLTDLDDSLNTTVGSLSNKEFIIMHPSLGYFADDFGLEMVAIEEEGKDASVSHMQAVIDYANEHDIRVVLYQQEFDSTQAETIAGEIGGEVMEFEPLAADYYENMMALAELFQNIME